MNANVAPLHDDQADDTVAHTWDEDTLEQVEQHAATTADIKKKRKALNDELAASKSKLVAIGFNADALKAAISYANTPEDDRGTWDQTYIFARKALGCPIQEDLFMEAMSGNLTVETKAED
jgi:hypothetical protein